MPFHYPKRFTPKNGSIFRNRDSFLRESTWTRHVPTICCPIVTLCGPGLTSGYVAVSVYHIVGKRLGPYIEAEISSAITFVFIKLNH